MIDLIHGWIQTIPYNQLFFFGLVVTLAFHFYGDHHCQGSFVSDHKCHKNYWMFYHTGLYACFVGAWISFYFGIPLWTMPILWASHWAIDHTVKCNLKFIVWVKDNCNYSIWIDWLDLIAHLIVIGGLIWLS